MTDNKPVTRFFQTKIIPPALWNACDFVLQYNFVIAHIPGAMNTAADYLSRLEYHITEKVELEIRDDIPVQAIEVNIQSAGVSEEEVTFLEPDDPKAEEQLWKFKADMREKAKTDSHNDPENNVTQL